MSAGQDNSGGAEQRRFVRVPINLDGLLVIGSGEAVPCTVRDYCVGGMFITADPAAYASVAPQTPAILYFALIVDGEKRDYQIELSIARAVAKGLGVSFVNPDDQTLGLLGQLAGAASTPTEQHAAGAAADAAPEFAELAADLCALVAEHFGNICETFIDRVDEKLFLAARDAGNNVDETRFLDGQREMRARQEDLRTRVPDIVVGGVRTLSNPFSDREKDAGSIGLSDLSLVEKDEFEDFLAVSEIVSELEPRFSEALFELGHRMSYLAGRNIDNSGLPVGPNVLCTAISDCIKGLQSERQVTTRIYQVLQQVMEQHLGDFYATVNGLLIDRGVIPVIDRSKPAVKRKQSAETGFGAEPEPPPVVEEDDLTDLMPGPEGYDGQTQIQQPSPAVHGGAQVRRAPSPGGAQVVPAAPSVTGAAAPAIATGGAPGNVAPAPAAAGVAAPPPGSAGLQQVPAGTVQAAPPGAVTAAPPGAVQAAPPGGVQAAPAGSVTAAPAGAVQAAAPSVPGVQAAGASVPGSVSAGETTGGAQSLPGIWAGAPAGVGAPVVQRAYSAAQAQMALRRDLAPAVAGAGLSDTVRRRGAYSTRQVADGLSALQQEFSGEETGELLDVEAIKQRVIDALVDDGAPQKMVEGEAADAIEVVANLFSAMVRDAMLAKSAKSELTRLQPSVHRAALMDPEFFASSDHPVRQVINRVARLRDGSSDAQKARQAQVRSIVSRANNEYREDLSVFDDVISELDDVLGGQEDEYREKVGAVVESCKSQQRVIEERRGESYEDTDGPKSDLPEEWNKWLERSRKLEVGQRMMMNAGTPRAAVVTLVWKEARGNLFVFADEQGNKASSLALQQVAMYLRRGVLQPVDEAVAEESAVDRAMSGVVGRFHSQLESEATRDAQTGFLLRKHFAELIDAQPTDDEQAAARNVAVCQLSLENLREVNDEHGDAAGDALIKALAEKLTELVRGKDIAFGRLDGTLFGIFWPTGGIEAAYKKMQGVVEQLGALAIVPPGAAADDDPDATRKLDETASEAATLGRATGQTLSPKLVAGITGGGDEFTRSDSLLAGAREACDTARGMGIGSLYVAGSEDAQRERLVQLAAYADKALERGALTLSAQHITSISGDGELPALYIAIGALDRNDRPIPPQMFGPAADLCENAAAIDAWAFKRTLAWMLDYEDDADGYALVVIPLSSASLRNEDLTSVIMGEFMETPVPPGRICFTIPDKDVVDNLVEVAELVGTLKEFGCRFMLDEFGSGHDNYDYIKTIDVDFVTVKSSFIADATGNPKDFAMAKSINELVHFMGKKTVARVPAGTDAGDTVREIGVDFVHETVDKALLYSKEMQS